MSTNDNRSGPPADHDVGYRKPPKHGQFKKGRSGNPAGRPKGLKSFKTFLMAALDEKVTVSENGHSRRITKREAAAKQIANSAAMGDLRTFKLMVELLADREEREEDKIQHHNSHSARERLTKKLDEMAVRLRARFDLPPETS
jgi:hypothetical protein